MTSKKKVAVKIAKVALFAFFLIHVGFFSLLDASHRDEHLEEKAKLEILGKRFDTKSQQLIKNNASIEEIQAAAKKYRQEIEEIKSHRTEAFAMLSSIETKEALSWLLSAYLYLLSWFACLFLIWFFEGFEEHKIFLANSLSLIISVILYPIVAIRIAYVWLDEKKNVDDVTKVKQRFFKMLSDDDIERIQRFARDCLHDVTQEPRSIERGLRQFPFLVERCLDGFVMEVDHVPDTLAVVELTNWNIKPKK
ncbi:MAG: hypothetical protein QY321_03995 [Patescibacteria group bacterium]|nr:MAG: hypothetical protein QY321_03995 [Patescibacteria group bacterium]